MDTPTRPANLPAGTLVAGRYRLKERIGQGSSGVVYRARHTELRRDFAVKLLNPEVELDRRRRGTTSFRHRFAVPLREAGKDRELGLRYLVMDLVEGRSLADVLRGHALRPESAVRLGRQVLEAVAYAHRAGLIHRDLKPSKVLLTELEQGKEEVRVLGFGLAEAVDPSALGGDVEEVLRRAEELRARVVARDPKLVTTTRLKPVVEPPPGRKADYEDLTYVSPELLLGRHHDGRTDVYSVGAILYEALSRRRPFEADPSAPDPAEELKLRIEGEPPRDLAQVAPRVPAGLCEEVMRALSKAPFDRHESAARFRRALREGLARVSLQDPTVASNIGGDGAEALTVKATERGKPDPVEEEPRPQVKVTLPTGARCPSCHKLLKETGTVRCAECRAVHHAHCFRVHAACAECGHGEYEGGERIRIEPPAYGMRRALLFRLVLPLALLVTVVLGGLFAVRRGLGPAWLLGDSSGRFLRLRGVSQTPPSWYQRLDEVERPPLIPQGFGYGATEGEYVNRRDGSVLVWVPPGTFRFGPPGEATPTRVRHGFFIGKYELTWAQYARFCAETQRKPPSKQPGEGLLPYAVGPDHPVFNVSLADAEAYCEWAKLRLPTHVEWEYAARGADDAREYPWGDEAPTARRGLVDDMKLRYRTRAVGESENASPFGCRDMFGNVREWQGDLASNQLGVVCGGTNPVYWSSQLSPRTRDGTIGFRVAADLQALPPPPGN